MREAGKEKLIVADGQQFEIATQLRESSEFSHRIETGWYGLVFRAEIPRRVEIQRGESCQASQDVHANGESASADDAERKRLEAVQ